MCAIGGALPKVKRESRALVFISPETNAPIDHYHRCSDQSSSSTASEEGLSITKTQPTPVFDPLEVSRNGAIPELSSHSKLHHWMAPSFAESELDLTPQVYGDGLSQGLGVGNGAEGLGLYFYGMSNIWSQNLVPMDPVLPNYNVTYQTQLDDDLSLSCALNNEVSDLNIWNYKSNKSIIDVSPQQVGDGGGVPKTSRLWTWMGDTQ